MKVVGTTGIRIIIIILRIKEFLYLYFYCLRFVIEML